MKGKCWFLPIFLNQLKAELEEWTNIYVYEQVANISKHNET